jgi:5-(carboxyamino)imidazole ribonucleotide mutase
MAAPSPATAKVLLIAGSPSDLDRVLDCQETLEELGLASDIRILSAHRTPEATARCAQAAEDEGFRAIIAFAGMAAHLAGVCAAYTVLPVIAVPCAVGALQGVDAALASLQMPPGTPVAAVAIDGARNAALLAARILGAGDAALRERLRERALSDHARYEPTRIAAEVEKRKQARRGARGR